MRVPFFSTLFEKTQILALFLKHYPIRQLQEVIVRPNVEFARVILKKWSHISLYILNVCSG